MQKHVLAIMVGLGLTVSAVYLLVAKPVVAAQLERSSAVFNADGTLQLPNPHFFEGGSLLCILGAFSVYGLLILGRTISWRTAFPVYSAVAFVGMLAGFGTALVT